MKINGKIVLFCILLMIPAVIFARETSDKIKSRFGAEISADLGDNLSGGIEIEERLQFNNIRIEEHILEPKLDYDLSKSFRVGVRYRLTLERDLEDGRQWDQRAQIYLRYDTDFDDFELKIKSALQYQLDEFNSPLLDVRNELVSRYSVQLDYNWFGTKLTPSAEYEIFYHMNNLNGGILYQWRAKIACTYDWQNNIDLNFFYFYDHEFNITEPENAHVFGISLNFSL